MYQKGEGVTQDYMEAAKWFRLSAEQGNGHGQLNLGVSYANGQGVTQDYLHALMWFNLAGSRLNGEEGSRATENRDNIANALTPAQVAQAQEMARQCEARHFKNCD
jgi:TPR repeat protein